MRVRGVGALVAALIVSGLGVASCDDLTARPDNRSRFAYLIQTSATAPDGEPGTQVRLARFTAGLKLRRFGLPQPTPKAADVKTVLDTATVTSPTQVHKLLASPLNTRVLVHSSELPIGALDENLQVWNMATATGGLLFNEHSAAGYMNKTTCPSAVFKAYLAAAYPGAPPATTDPIDYELSVEGMDGANIAPPQILGWIDEQKVALKWKFRFNTSDGGASLEDTFDIVVTWPTGGGNPTMVCAPAPAIPSVPTVLTADPTIKLRKKAVIFGDATRNALKIAGNISP
jgi:hypothetical protein